MEDGVFTAVASISEVPTGTAKAIHFGGLSILLCNSDERIFAVINQCSHALEELTCGRIKYGWIACPAHGARFDLETGEALTPPATAPIRTFPVRIDRDVISIALG